MAQKPFC